MPEADLYPLVRSWFEAEFPLVRGRSHQETKRRVLVTANLNWIDGGVWMRPDLALIHVHRRRFEPVPTLDLYTIEVKPAGTPALHGLHQTLAQGRIGDFVVFVLPQESGPGPELIAQARRFGVGLVTFTDPELWSSYQLIAPPERTNPDPDLRDQFLSKALEAKGQTAEVLSWLGLEPGR